MSTCTVQVYSTFYPFEVVDHVGEVQLEVGANG